MRRLKRAVLAGALAAGCSIPKIEYVQPETPKPAVIKEKPRAVDCRAKGKIFACLVETAKKDCKDDGCVNEKLAKEFEFPGKETKYSMTVAKGDEVLSLIIGDSDYAMVLRIEVAEIDDKGVQLKFTNHEVREFDLKKGKAVDEISFRVNFDGTTEGEVGKINPLEIWGLAVEKAEGGAKVSFSTKDKRIVAGAEKREKESKEPEEKEGYVPFPELQGSKNQ